MMRKHLLQAVAAIGLIVGASAAGQSGAAQAAGDPASCHNVTFSNVGWTDISATTGTATVILQALVQPQPGQTWILVTSAVHMPRSVGLFRAAGWPVLPWPVGYKSGHGVMMWLPYSRGKHLVQLDEAMHEWIGLVAYRIMGRIGTVFPGPDN